MKEDAPSHRAPREAASEPRPRIRTPSSPRALHGFYASDGGKGRSTRRERESGSRMVEQGMGGGSVESDVVREKEASVWMSSVRPGERDGVGMVIIVEAR